MLSENKIGIVIVVYNIADLIKLQVECIRRFCVDKNYDIIVMDNSSDEKISESINYHSELLQVTRYVRCKASSINGSESHAFACNLAYLMFKNEYRFFAFFDHDTFAVKHFSITGLLTEKIIAGVGQTKAEYTYFWPGCLLWDNLYIDEEINFSPNNEKGVDTGGEFHTVFDRYGMTGCRFFDEIYEQNPNFTKNKHNFYSLIMDKTFMHFFAGSNWDGQEHHTERLNSLINILREKLER